MAFPERYKKSVGKKEWNKIIKRYEESKTVQKKFEEKNPERIKRFNKKEYLREALLISDVEADLIEKNRERVDWKKIKKYPGFKSYPFEMRIVHLKTTLERGLFKHQYLLINFGKVTPASTFPLIESIFGKEGYVLRKGSSSGDNVITAYTSKDVRSSIQHLKILFSRMRRKNLTLFKPSK